MNDSSPPSPPEILPAETDAEDQRDILSIGSSSVPERVDPAPEPSQSDGPVVSLEVESNGLPIESSSDAVIRPEDAFSNGVHLKWSVHLRQVVTKVFVEDGEPAAPQHEPGIGPRCSVRSSHSVADLSLHAQVSRGTVATGLGDEAGPGLSSTRLDGEPLNGLLERIAHAVERLADVGEALTSSSPSLVALPENRSSSMLIESTAGTNRIELSLERIADAVAPAPVEIIGTPEIAKRLGCTTVWVAEMARKGDIPTACVVPGTGNGKPWKFYREKIERWLEGR
jgi:hypothetical protein